jgi:methylated-DNA-[protein]-cysteine S-methyltransferase
MDLNGYNVTHMASPVGELTLVASDLGLRSVTWPNERPGRVAPAPGPVSNHSHPVLEIAQRQLSEYFAGERTEFDVPLDLVGTPFQRAAWLSLATIPYGETVSYGEQARRLGRPKAARAVGAANGRNPISIILPCHRVVASSGALTGFAGGLDVKRMLLEHERVSLYDVVDRTQLPT